MVTGTCCVPVDVNLKLNATRDFQKKRYGCRSLPTLLTGRLLKSSYSKTGRLYLENSYSRLMAFLFAGNG